MLVDDTVAEERLLPDYSPSLVTLSQRQARDLSSGFPLLAVCTEGRALEKERERRSDPYLASVAVGSRGSRILF